MQMADLNTWPLQTLKQTPIVRALCVSVYVCLFERSHVLLTEASLI